LTNTALRTDEVDRLESLLGHSFVDQSLLRRAITHASALPRTASYERLEFLGDRVLGLILADYFHSACPDDDEGALSTRLHAAARQSTLAAVARDLDIAPLIRAQSGMDIITSDGVLSDVVESLLAALYLDAGLEAARRFVTGHWPLDLGALAQADKDAKSRLQELAMKRGMALPQYRLVSRSGADHTPQMVYAVSVDGYGEEQAAGASRKQAEQIAASRLIAVMMADDADSNEQD
jgi:ribonuclease-3